MDSAPGNSGQGVDLPGPKSPAAARPDLAAGRSDQGILADDRPLGSARQSMPRNSSATFRAVRLRYPAGSWVSQELGRSVFVLAIEEGLRGQADLEGGKAMAGDGHRTARYVTNRTRAWSAHVMPRRRRFRFEKRSSHARLADFTLARRNRVRTTASQSATEPDLRAYPTGSEPHGCDAMDSWRAEQGGWFPALSGRRTQP